METETKALYILKDVPGKGKGLIAKKKIRRGTRILEEQPIITIPLSYSAQSLAHIQRIVTEAVKPLEESQRQVLLSLQNNFPYDNEADQYLGIINTNALPIGDSEDDGAVYPEASRINHSCCKNAQHSWNTNIKRHTVHALSDIAKGEEITISYLETGQTREARQKSLLQRFGFWCSCQLCALSPAETLVSDWRITEIDRLEGIVGQKGAAGIQSSPEEVLCHIHAQAQLLCEQLGEKVSSTALSRAFQDAAQITVAHGDLARGRIFARRAATGWEISHGSDSKEYLSRLWLAVDPNYLQMYGQSKRWSRELDDVPSKLSESGFENWLWRRDKSSRQVCAACGKSTPVRCAGCIDAPVYKNGEYMAVFYCKRECQVAHRDKHKASCKVWHGRKKLLRVAEVLKAIFIAYRESTFDLNLQRLDIEGDFLRLYLNETDSETEDLSPYELPANAHYVNWLEEAVLTDRQSSLAMPLLGRLARYLLSELRFGITQEDVRIGKPRIRIARGSNIPTMTLNTDETHTVLIIRSEHHEKWVIDATASQFGLINPLMPYDQYMAERGCEKQGPPRPYDVTETVDIDLHMNAPAAEVSPQRRKNLEKQRAARLRFAEFVEKRIAEKGFLKTVFEGLGGVFETKLNALAGDLTAHMKQSTKKD